MIDDEQVAFNGDEDFDEDFETFRITRQPKGRQTDDGAFNFCKTGQRPYDTVVVATLCVLSTLAPRALEVRSDGERHEWAAGLALAQRFFSDAQIPPGVGGHEE